MPETTTPDYEKLGVFYLGKTYDLAAKKRGEEPILYDSKDLVTHAVCVGMTGSGKTGLCIDVLEEAAIDGIPAIIIDPKGDLSNLLLTFPNLKGSDFLPWINEEDAAKKGLTPQQFADAQAALWTKGLADWHQDAARIQRLRDAADVVVYTPGSNAGLPVSILKSFARPPQAILDDEESLRERIATTATSLLGLLGIDADPIKSREHILLSNILNAAWAGGRDLDLAGLIQQIQTPPIQRVGVMELDAFFPSKDRFALAMQLNNLLASPSFQAWMEGEPLDIAAALRTPQGKPRLAIYSVAHLADAERMFFVSLLLSQMLGWVRQQSGTTSLRALLYMDEIAGYFPPTANPPSKAPLLTLMKQARAFGVGVMLATQNPVDLDYKGLSNAGTWFIGRLQTERDKMRVLDGLEGAAAQASAGFDRGKVEKILSQLGSRVFLMNNVHDDGPVIFETRWALSYLRGPLTKSQIKKLMDAKRSGAAANATTGPATSASVAATPTAAPATNTSSAKPAVNGTARPLLPPEIKQCFLPLRSLKPAGSTLTYQPMLLGRATVYFRDTKAGIDESKPASLLTALSTGPVTVNWEESQATDLTEADVEAEPAAGAAFAALPADASKPKSYDTWLKGFTDIAYRTQSLDVFKSPSTGEVSKPGESERDFRARLDHVAREQRDALAAKLRTKYASKVQTLTDRIRRAEQALEVQKGQAKEAKLQTAISFGAAILGAFLGKKSINVGSVGRATTAVRGVGRSVRESGDVGRAEENIDALQQQLKELETQLQSEIDAAHATIDPLTEKLDTIAVKPKKTDVQVKALFLAWAPAWADPAGSLQRAW